MATAAIIVAVVGVLSWIGLQVVTSLVQQEVLGWIPHLSLGLLRLAVRQLPPAHRDRWLEEWEAELATLRDRPLTCLLTAVGFVFAVRGVCGAISPAAQPSGQIERSSHVIAPELALVDPELAARARALLPEPTRYERRSRDTTRPTTTR
jgi:hypothetical protein